MSEIVELPDFITYQQLTELLDGDPEIIEIKMATWVGMRLMKREYGKPWDQETSDVESSFELTVGERTITVSQVTP